jgi:glycosyltransferase involved in cell wall biosynthesis
MAACGQHYIEFYAMKILIITDGIFPFVVGGMQKHSFYLAKFLALQNHTITVVHCVAHDKELPSEMEVRSAMELPAYAPVESIALHFPKPGAMPGHYLKESYQYSKHVYNRIKDRLNDFDFIYAKGFAAWYLLHEKSKGMSMPPVGVKFHGYEMFQPAGSLKTKLEAWMLRGPVKWNNLQADYVFSYGGKITTLIKEKIGVATNKIIEIPTGIESAWCLNELPNSTEGPLNFVFIGRYERRKGVEELTEVLADLVGKYAFQMHFIGPIPPTKKIQSEQVIYHGQITNKEEIQKILDNCQVLVTPSHSEGMPNVIMEGMARGLAVLATDVGAVPVVVSEANGWLLAPRDKVALKQTIEAICSFGSADIQLKRLASLAKIKEFYWENIAKKTAEVTKVLLDKR